MSTGVKGNVVPGAGQHADGPRLLADIGGTSQTLLGRVKRDEVDSGEREGVTTSERERLKALAREVKELRRANEILKLASAFFAQASSAGAIALR